MNNNLTTTNQNSKLALAKSKSLLDLTNKILANKNGNDLLESYENYRLLESSVHNDSVSSIAITPDGKYILSVCMKTIKQWDIRTGEHIRSFNGHDNSIESMAITSNGKYLVSGSSDMTVRLWDLSSGEYIRSFNGHKGKVNSVAVTQDGQHIVSSDSNCAVKLWNINNTKELWSYWLHNYSVTSVSISPDEKCILSVDSRGNANILKLDSGQVTRSFNLLHEVFAAVITPDGKYLISTEGYYGVYLYDINSGKKLRKFDGHLETITSTVITSDGQYIVSSSYQNNYDIQRYSQIMLYETNSGKEIQMFGNGQEGKINSVAITPNGNYIISGSQDGAIQLWETSSGKCISIFTSFDDGEWLARKLNGEYNCSDGAYKHFSFVGNSKNMSETIPQNHPVYKAKKKEILLSNYIAGENPYLGTPPLKTDIDEAALIPNGVWLDPETKLMWQDDEAAATVKKPLITQSNYDEGDDMNTSGDTAATYASNLTLGGYNDWRLPTIDELEDLYEKKDKLKNVNSSVYWSSTTYEGGKHGAWFVGFFGGYVYVDGKYNYLLVRCVRAGQ